MVPFSLWYSTVTWVSYIEFRNKLMHQYCTEKSKENQKLEYAHRRLNLTMTYKWLFPSTSKQQTDAQEDNWKWDNKEAIVAIPREALLKQPSALSMKLCFSSSSSFPPLCSKLSHVSLNPLLFLFDSLLIFSIKLRQLPFPPKKGFFFSPAITLPLCNQPSFSLSYPSFSLDSISSFLNCLLYTKSSPLLFLHASHPL